MEKENHQPPGKLKQKKVVILMVRKLLDFWKRKKKTQHIIFVLDNDLLTEEVLESIEQDDLFKAGSFSPP